MVKPGNGRSTLAHDLLYGHIRAQGVVGHDSCDARRDWALRDEAELLAAESVPVPAVNKDQYMRLRLRSGKDVQALGQRGSERDIKHALKLLTGLSALLCVELLVAREVGHGLSQVVLCVQLFLGRETAVEHVPPLPSGLSKELVGGSEGPLRRSRVGGVSVDIDYNPVLHLSWPYRCPIHKPSRGAGTPDAGTTKGCSSWPRPL